MHRLTAAQIADLTGVDITTARRWKRGGAVPEPVRRLVSILVHRDLGAFCERWKGWTLANGVLASPENWCYTPGEVRALTFLREEMRRREDARTPAPVPPGTCFDWIDETWRFAEALPRYEPLWPEVLRVANEARDPYVRPIFTREPSAA